MQYMILWKQEVFILQLLSSYEVEISSSVELIIIVACPGLPPPTVTNFLGSCMSSQCKKAIIT